MYLLNANKISGMRYLLFQKKRIYFFTSGNKFRTNVNNVGFPALQNFTTAGINWKLQKDFFYIF